MKHQSFLNFRDHKILYIHHDGQIWISVRALMQALSIADSRFHKNLKNDPILGPAMAIWPMQVPSKQGNQSRKVTCIPEFLVYGLIFSVRSENPEIIDYKRTCYEILYNHFHGTISINERKKIIQERAKTNESIALLESKIKETLVDEHDQLRKLKTKRNRLSEKLNDQDKAFAQQDLGF